MNVENDNETEDASAPPEAEGWLSLSEVARLKGVERQTIWEKVARLEQDGLIKTRTGKGKTKLVNLLEYDRAAGETTDFAKAQAAATRAASGDPDGDPKYSDAQRQKLNWEARLKALEYARQTGQLVSLENMQAVTAEVANAAIEPLEQISLRADEITSAALRGGAAAVRAILKDIVFGLRKAIADALLKLNAKGVGGEEIEVAAEDEDDPS